MENLGLLAGLAEGIKSGLGSYQAEKDRQLKYKQYEDSVKEREEAKRQAKLGLLLKGQESGQKAILDEAGEVTGFEYDPQSPVAKAKEEDRAIGLLKGGLIKTPDGKIDKDPLVKRRDLAEIAKIEAETQKTTNEKRLGKELPAASLTDISNATNAVKQLGSLRDAIENNKAKFGLAQGTWSGLKSMVGQDDDASVLQTQIDANVQEIGRFLEGGKLAEGDAKRYKAMAPKITDTPEAAMRKAMLLEKMVADKQASNLAALSAGGFRTEGLPTASGLLSKQEQPGLLNKNQPSQPQTKVVDGVTFKKVPGGWEEL